MQSDLSPLHEVCRALGDYVCPLYALENSRVRLVGTGVPMHIGDLAFIITAAHVAEQFDERPLVTIGRDRLLEVTGKRVGYKYLKNERVDTDLAVVQLDTREADEMMKRFSFSTPMDVAHVAQAESKYILYSLVGYPFSRNRPKPRGFKVITARPTYVTTNRRAALPRRGVDGKHEEVHFALWADADKIVNADSKPITLPKAQGMSGGGVWRIDVDDSSGQPGSPKLVGIGIEPPHQDDLFVATRVHYIVPLLRDLYQGSASSAGA
jgi:hypothetical protein